MLEEFIPAYLEQKTAYHKKLVQLIPKQFLTEKTDCYTRIQTILDFVSGMTDFSPSNYSVRLKASFITMS